jgi:hypothetical protein
LEITNQFPDLVKESLARKGVNWPDFTPGLAELVAEVEPESGSAIATGTDTTETVCRDVLKGCKEEEGSVELTSNVPEFYGPAPANNPTEAEQTGTVRLVFFWADT